MNILNRLKNVALLIAITLLVLACDKSFLYKEPKGTVIPASLQTKEGVEYLLVGAYSLLDGWGSGIGGQWSASAASPRNWVWAIASDDAYKGSTPGDGPQIGEIERYEALPTNQMVESAWMIGYDAISRCNDALRALNAISGTISEDEFNVLAAQARFLRAHFHFGLQRIYYQVPYITEDIQNPTAITNDRPVWNDIENDLAFAIDNLPSSFPGEPGRATRWAALATKAYVHLFQHEFSDAKGLLDQIIVSEKFKLVDSFYHNYTSYTENNTESIFEIQSSVNDGTVQGQNGNADSWLTNPYNRFMPTCCGFYQPSQDLVNAFKVDEDGLPLLGVAGPRFNDEDLANDMGLNSGENFIPTDHLLDPRLDWSIGRRGIPYMDWGVHSGRDWIRDQDNGGPYLSKKQMYSKAEQATAAEATYARATAINFRLIRYAHVLLWRAECAVEENDLERARQLVNMVRARSADDNVMGKVAATSFGSDPVTVNWDKPAANYLLGEYPVFPGQDYAREAVRMEIRLETAMEGNRYFDLVRWGIHGDVLPKFIENDRKIRTYMIGAQYNAERNDNWPIPQSQIDLQPGVLIQDPAY